jgi:hypothetical protein
MPEKILRLGMTEFSLLFMYWLNKYKQIKTTELIKSKITLIKWLYSTSGYYDNTINCTYMDAIHTENDTETYIKYMETLLEFIKNSNIYTFCFHNFTLLDEMKEFKLLINPKTNIHLNQSIVFNFIKNKKVLIISPFAPLIQEQIISGNCKKIFDNTPSVDDIYTYTFPYTFFNKGPHNNILETVDCIYDEIINSVHNEYESVLISCGAYSCLIAKKMYDNGKNVCTIGGDLQSMVGILNGRTRAYYIKQNKEIPNKEYWITNIPDNYKPHDYMKIENGCYW